MAAAATLTNSTPPTADRNQWRFRASFALSALAVLFLLFDCVIKLLEVGPVIDSFTQLGYPVSLARGIGILELACLTLYVLPRTAVLGAIVLTGFLGGAIATHLRVGDPLMSHVLFPVYIGLLIWGGLFLRDDTLRTLLPIRK